jgi:hypothetical protein
VEFSGIPAAAAQKARDAFNALQLGQRLSERRVEDISKYWVFIPATNDRRAAETRMAELRRQGVADLSLRPDNAISLGVFSSEEAARRFLTTITARGVKSAEQGPFSRDLRELVMLIREPDTELVARLTVMQRDYPNAQLRAVPLPINGVRVDFQHRNPRAATTPGDYSTLTPLIPSGGAGRAPPGPHADRCALRAARRIPDYREPSRSPRELPPRSPGKAPTRRGADKRNGGRSPSFRVPCRVSAKTPSRPLTPVH